MTLQIDGVSTAHERTIDHAIRYGHFDELKQHEPMDAMSASIIRKLAALPLHEMIKRHNDPTDKFNYQLGTKLYYGLDDNYNRVRNFITNELDAYELCAEAEGVYGELATLLSTLTLELENTSESSSSERRKKIVGDITETAFFALMARDLTLSLQAIGESKVGDDDVYIPYPATKYQDEGGAIGTDLLLANMTTGRTTNVQIKTRLKKDDFEKYDTSKILLLGLNSITPTNNHAAILKHPLVTSILCETSGSYTEKDQDFLNAAGEEVKRRVRNHPTQYRK